MPKYTVIYLPSTGDQEETPIVVEADSHLSIEDKTIEDIIGGPIVWITAIIEGTPKVYIMNKEE